MRTSTKLSLLALFAATNLGVASVQAASVDVGASVGAAASTASSSAASVGADAGASVSTGSDTSSDDTSVEADVDANVDANADADVGSEDASVGVGADADVVANVGENGEIDADIGAFTIVNLNGSDVTADVDIALNTLIETDIDQLEDIRAEVEANAEIIAELEAEGLTVEDILGLTRDENGTTTVFVADGPVALTCSGSTVSGIDSDASADDISSADNALIASLSGCDTIATTVSNDQLAMLEANSEITSEIRSQGYTANDVVAVDDAGGDTLKIFVRAQG